MTNASFYILLSLSATERHGYDILKRVDAISSGKVALGPGTLYTNLKRMEEAGLILEIHRPAARHEDSRRRYYRLSSTGRTELNAELERMKQAIAIARHALAGETS